MSNIYDGGIDGVRLGVDVGPSGVYMDDGNARQYVDDLRKEGRSRLSSLQYTDFRNRMKQYNDGVAQREECHCSAAEL